MNGVPGAAAGRDSRNLRGMILISLHVFRGAYGDRLQGMIHFYDNGNQNPDTIPVGEAGTAVLNLQSRESHP